MLGVSTLRIIFVEILPNVVSPAVVLASLIVADAILLEAGISFLGLGEGRSTIRDAWWLSLFPGVAVVATVLALNLIGDGLNDALNPRLLGVDAYDRHTNPPDRRLVRGLRQSKG